MVINTHCAWEAAVQVWVKLLHQYIGQYTQWEEGLYWETLRCLIENQSCLHGETQLRQKGKGENKKEMLNKTRNKKKITVPNANTCIIINIKDRLRIFKLTWRCRLKFEEVSTDRSTAVDCSVVSMCCRNWLTKINKHRCLFRCVITLHVAVITKIKS